MGKGERVGVSDRVAHVACRQAAYSGRTTPNRNGHRPSAQSANRRIGRDRCARIERRPAAVQTIVVEHRDRLARFGSESIAAALAACGRKLVVVDETEMKDDLVQDMVVVLTWFCARLYGRRAAKNRAAKALAAAQADG